jgi:homocitrate synthase NifV
MIHIIDRTLSALDDMPLNVSVLSRFLELLIQTGPDAIELSQRMFHLLSPLPDYPGYIVRIRQIEDAAKYPGVSGFVCRGAPADSKGNITPEILLDNIRDVNKFFHFKYCEKIRVQGLGNIITEDYLNIFARLRESFCSDIEFCPTDRYNFATALASEWLINGAASSGASNSGAISSVVTSFGGIGGLAYTEEVLMILKLAGLRNEEKTYEFFPEMANLLNKITAKPISLNKPILGKCIFHVESGIHVDGILKDPKCYEPFQPETVGLKREIIIGKHSGTASIMAKLAELGIQCEQEKIPAVLEGVRAKGEEKRGALNDSEFEQVVRECAA